MQYSQEPIMNIEWRNADSLQANDYNPNRVFSPELKLLKLSIIKNGWLQALLITPDGTIIDGYHRSWLSINDKEIIEKYDGKVPCIVFDITEPERMLLTVRINRAKGAHIALKMHELVTTLHNVHGYPVEEIARQIGGSNDEVRLLLKEATRLFRGY
jgi:hypothetical protein